jgi:general transcription factor 3C polypeptide 3 (transcription factor C subunit 4)
MAQRVQKLLGAANMHYAYREFQQAVQMLVEVVRIAPGMPQPYQTLGLIYEELAQYPKALKLFMMAAHLSKKDVHQWRQLAAMCAKHGDTEQAIYCLGRILAHAPSDVDALWQRAQLLADSGEHKRAVSALHSLLHKRPDDTQVVQRLTRSYYKLGALGKAEKLLKSLLRGEPAAASVAGSSSAAAAVDAAGSSAGVPTAARPPRLVEMHSLNMLAELLFERGRFREALEWLSGYVAAVQLSKRAWTPPYELQVKQGVAHAYLGEIDA